jgi:hypothetical protein
VFTPHVPYEAFTPIERFPGFVYIASEVITVPPKLTDVFRCVEADPAAWQSPQIEPPPVVVVRWFVCEPVFSELVSSWQAAHPAIAVPQLYGVVFGCTRLAVVYPALWQMFVPQVPLVPGYVKPVYVIVYEPPRTVLEPP